MNRKLVAGFTAVTTATVLLVGLNSTSDANSTATVPQCQEEDGSTQQICAWSDGSGDVLVNIDWGHWTYNITEHELTEWK